MTRYTSLVASNTRIENEGCIFEHDSCCHEYLVLDSSFRTFKKELNELNEKNLVGVTFKISSPIKYEMINCIYDSERLLALYPEFHCPHNAAKQLLATHYDLDVKYISQY